MAHRVLAGGVGLLAGWIAFQAWRRWSAAPSLGRAGFLTLGLLLAQILVGAANPWSQFSPVVQVLHLSLATALWGSLVWLTLLTWRLAVRPLHAPPSRLSSQGLPFGRVLADYISLTKPRIMLLLLTTALGGMFLAAQGPPPLSLAALVLLGGGLASGGASAINHYLDKAVDERMSRTRRRPVAAGRVQPWRALVFGIVLNVLAFIILAAGANLLSALLALGASLFYVLVYTMWLKLATPQNIVIGGAAGAMPPLIGWAAVTGSVDLPALYLFAIIFFWTPPHFWALSLLLRSDYARAGIPMLPVVRGVKTTAWNILSHAMVLVAVTVLFFTTKAVGWLYLLGAVGLGVPFLGLAWRLLLRGGSREAQQLYLYSLFYLGALFAFVVADSTLRP